MSFGFSREEMANASDRLRQQSYGWSHVQS
jgi:hypothetical protein